MYERILKLCALILIIIMSFNKNSWVKKIIKRTAKGSCQESELLLSESPSIVPGSFKQAYCAS